MTKGQFATSCNLYFDYTSSIAQCEAPHSRDFACFSLDRIEKVIKVASQCYKYRIPPR